MPHYDYLREDGSTFEYFQHMKDGQLVFCPTTGQFVKRLISRGLPPQFKGKGFYQTDYPSRRGGRNGRWND